MTVLSASYLCMFEGVHDEDGEAQSEDVGQEAGVEIRPAVFIQAADRRQFYMKVNTEHSSYLNLTNERKQRKRGS